MAEFMERDPGTWTEEEWALVLDMQQNQTAEGPVGEFPYQEETDDSFLGALATDLSRGLSPEEYLIQPVLEKMGVENAGEIALAASIIGPGVSKFNPLKWIKGLKKGTKLSKKSLQSLKKDDLIDMIIPPKKTLGQKTKDYFKDIPKKAWEGTKKSIDPRVHPIRKGIKAGGMAYQQFGAEEGITSPLTAIPIPLPFIGATPLSSISGLQNLIRDIGGTELAQKGIAKTADIVNTISKAVGGGDVLPSGEEFKQVMGVEPQDTTKQKLLIDNPAVTNMIDSLMNKRAYTNPRLKQLYKDSSVQNYIQEKWGF